MKHLIIWIIIFCLIVFLNFWFNSAKVVAVIDGDTIVVNEWGESFTVRMIWIDTPERWQCGYEEAKQHLENIISKRVLLLYDKNKDKEDKYWRRLQYVVSLYQDFNEEMIRSWWAREKSFNSFYQRKYKFLSAQKYAIRKNFGIWKYCEQ